MSLNPRVELNIDVQLAVALVNVCSHHKNARSNCTDRNNFELAQICVCHRNDFFTYSVGVSNNVQEKGVGE